MEIKDVFWLSVMCVPFAISFAQVYLPYNDIHVPPDMSGQSVSWLVLCLHFLAFWLSPMFWLSQISNVYSATAYNVATLAACRLP